MMSENTVNSRLEEEPKETGEQNPGFPENNSLEQWNDPKINTYRYLSALFTFVVMGMNDAVVGVGQFTVHLGLANSSSRL